MKKTLSIILAAALVLVLAATLFPATTAFAREATELVLVDVRFSFSNGLVLTFAANGKIGSYNLPSTVLINGKMVDVDCVVKNDERTVVCHTTKNLGFTEGDSGYVTVFGQTMNFSAPKILKNKPATEHSTGICPEGKYPYYEIEFYNPVTSATTYEGFLLYPGESIDEHVQNIHGNLEQVTNQSWEIVEVTLWGCGVR